MIPQIQPLFGNEEAEAVSEYIKSGGWLTEFAKTEELEKRLSVFTGAKYCSLVPNGTMALTIACMVIGVNQGDEVLVPGVSMIATANAPRSLGASIKFVDIDTTGCMDIDTAEKNIGYNTKAIIYVSLNGRSNDITKLKRVCEEKNIFLIEDACQSLGSFHKGVHLGTIGDIGCFSLSPHKIISTGQGGFLVTDSERIYDKIEKVKDFGRKNGGSDWHESFGVNAKFTDLQAVVGLEQIKKISSRISRKRDIYKKYCDTLNGVVSFVDLENATPWFTDIYIDEPNELKKYLYCKGIETRLMYPPIYKQPCYGEDIFLANSEMHSARGLWLPSSVSITDDEIYYVCKTIMDYERRR